MCNPCWVPSTRAAGGSRPAVWVGVAGLARHGCGGLGLDAATARHPGAAVCDRRGAPRQPHAQRVGQRHLQPTRSVTIGSELSGTVRNVLVDVNDKVKKGQVLVELDTAKLEAQVLRSRASLAAAQARLAQAVATTKEARGPGAAAGSGAPVGRQGAVGHRTGCGRPRWTAPRPTRPVPVHRWMTPARRSPPMKPISPRHRSVRPSTAWCSPAAWSPATPWPHRCRR
jgi:hypothetical protein